MPLGDIEGDRADRYLPLFEAIMPVREAP